MIPEIGMHCPNCKTAQFVKRIMFTTKNIQVTCKECGETQFYNEDKK
jgi:uncharacterized Zn finger protein